MNYFTYKMIHLISLTLMFVSFGFMLVAVAIGEPAQKFRKFSYALHGVSWLALFASAYGLVETLGMGANFPNWGRAKTAIWLMLGIWAFIVRKKPQWTFTNMAVLSVLGSAAIWLAVAKPMF